MSYIAERRLEEKERRRAEIVDAAEAAGREVGLDALTMDDVARRARLSRALLYVYFQDRSDLMFGLRRTRHGHVARALRRGAGASSQRARTGQRDGPRLRRVFAGISRAFDALARCELQSPEPTAGLAVRAGLRAGGDRLQAALVASIEAACATAAFAATSARRCS